MKKAPLSLKQVDDLGMVATEKMFQRRSLLCFEAATSYLLGAYSVREVQKILRSQADHLEEFAGGGA